MFYKTSAAQKRDWTESRQRCKDTGTDLVSIESVIKGIELLEKNYPKNEND